MRNESCRLIIKLLLLPAIAMTAVSCSKDCNCKYHPVEPVYFESVYFEPDIYAYNCSRSKTTVRVNIRTNTDWIATSSAYWCVIEDMKTSSASGDTIIKQNGDGVIKLSVEQNDTGNVRTAYIVCTYWFEDGSNLNKKVTITQFTQ